MNLYQNPDGYRYNSDTIMLYGFIEALGCKGRVLDIGCGCGILGLLLKRDFPKCDMTQIDIQACNVKLTQMNANENTLTSRIIEGDFLTSLMGEKFDMIVSNPPFYHQDVTKSENEHVAISRYNDYLPFPKMIEHANRLLTPHGKFYCCYDAKQLPELMDVFARYKLRVQKVQYVHSKRDKEASLVLIEAKKSSKSLCSILSPMIVHENGGYSKEATALFAKANTTSVSCQV